MSEKEEETPTPVAPSPNISPGRRRVRQSVVPPVERGELKSPPEKVRRRRKGFKLVNGGWMRERKET